MLLQDFRLAVRLLWKTRGATALSILSIALGIGLTTGIFSVEDAFLLRPLAIDRPELVFSAMSRADDGRSMLYGWPDYQDMRQSSAALGELAAYTRRVAMLTRGEEREMLFATPASSNYFSLLRVRAAVGRASLDESNGRPSAVLGYRAWMRLFGGDPRIAGKTIELGEKAFTVTGVMPAEFTGLARGIVNDVWINADAWFDVLGSGGERQSRNGQFEIVARLKQGVNPGAAAAQLDAAIRGAGKHKPAPQSASGTYLTPQHASDWKRIIMLGGVSVLVLALLLFIACANVAQLRLAQTEMRLKELGVRISLGAGTWRLVRQLLVESALVGLAGAGVGLVLARGFMLKAAQFLSQGLSFVDFGIRLDRRVLLFSLAATIFAVLLTGLAPARHVLRLGVVEILKSEQGSAGGRTGWQKQALVMTQIALSVVFFGMAVLSIQSLRNAMAIRPGLDPHKNLFLMTVSRGARIPSSEWCRQVSERIGGLPGVRAVTFARRVPLSGSGGGATVRVEQPGQAPFSVHFNNVGPNYFQVMGTRILAGRALNDNDRRGSTEVMVATQTFARQVFNDRNPLGQWVPVNGKPRQIVGIAEDANSNDIHGASEPFLYFALAQLPSGDVTVIVETAGKPAPLAQTIRNTVKEYDRRTLFFFASTLQQHMEQALTMDRVMATLTMIVAGFGVLLTGAGLFGVLQYGVNRRRREFGLRMALGATPDGIQRLILRGSFRMAAWGAPFGLLLLAFTAKYMQSVVPLASPSHPLVYILPALAAAAIALTAGWLPARRATRVDPATALRAE
jgi:macrolide transport system ATP-binding/permease protein